MQFLYFIGFCAGMILLGIAWLIIKWICKLNGVINATQTNKENNQQKIDYSRKDVYEIDKGEYKDYKYVMLYGGMYPCAYVQLKPEDKYYETYNYNDIDIDVHGGITFTEKYYKGIKYYLFKLGYRGHWIGWDYGHGGDYTGGGYGKKWTLEEIISDCEKVIEQLRVREVKYDIDYFDKDGLVVGNVNILITSKDYIEHIDTIVKQNFGWENKKDEE